jgi:hypothetical protein
MKKALFIFFIFVSLFSSCTEENASAEATPNEPNKVLLLKVDYLTNIELFENKVDRRIVMYTDSWHPLLVETCKDDIIQRIIDTIKDSI